ncbi:MAG: PilZ domain-containing protein [Sphingomonas sp.]|nr:PilZ domain-containing protein [Sphingomonas sp.]
MASGFFLDGTMIPRSERRTIDERAELRAAAVSNTAVLEFRGRKHVVQLVNISPSGAMVLFPHVPNIGERLPLQLLERGVVIAQVRWVRDGRIGLSFAAS